MTTEQALDQALTLLFGTYGGTWEDSLRVSHGLPDSQRDCRGATLGDLRRLSKPLLEARGV